MATPTAHRVSPAEVIDYAARLILRAAGAQPYDLSRCVVLLPNLYCAKPLALALSRHCPQQTIMLPRMYTLRGWAARVTLQQPVSSRAHQQALVFDALRVFARDTRANSARDTRAGSTREERVSSTREARANSARDSRANSASASQQAYWAMANEVVALVAELTHAQSSAQALQTALRTHGSHAAQLPLEAALVQQLWSALVSERSETLDHVLAYQLQLQHIVEQATAPLYAVGLSELSAAEQGFLQRYAERQAVHVVEASFSSGSDALQLSLLAAWPEIGASDAGEEALHQRAAQLRAAAPASVLLRRIFFAPGDSLEASAQIAVAQVQRLVAQGRCRIALIAQDRMLARRVRAVLERQRILARDESGWRLSTTAASAALMRLIDVVERNAYHADLLDLMKSPFVCADWPAPEREVLASTLQRHLRQHDYVRDWQRLLALLRGAEASQSELAQFSELAPLLELAPLPRLAQRLQEAQRALNGGRARLSEWLGRLSEAMRALRIDIGLQSDAAGAQLLQLLAQWRTELDAHGARYSRREWRAWLELQLEQASFVDESIDSPVVITQLASVQLREFDAVIVLGADAAHLGVVGAPPAFFNDEVRWRLGLSGEAQRQRAALQALAQLCCNAGEIVFVWQAYRDGAASALSQHLERLSALQQLAYGEALQTLPQTVAEPTPSRVEQPTVTAPAPLLPADLMPTRLSASGYASLLRCPYQFYAQYALRLREQEPVTEEVGGKDFGEWLHRVLQRLHAAYPIFAQLSNADLHAAFTRLADEELSHWETVDALAHAWRFRLAAWIDDYIAWQRAREAKGWQVHGAELPVKRDVDLAGVQIQLEGRLDRVDVDAQQRLAVLDYKSGNRERLKAKLAQPGEDVQLSLYALLSAPAQVAGVAYLSLADDVRELQPAQPLPELMRNELQRLAQLFSAMRAGARMRAQGVEDDCKYCDMRGLCRRDTWIGE